MQSQVDSISPVLVEVKVEVPWAQVSEKLEASYKNLQRTAHVRGFRPGKVPRQVVKNLMGKSVERDVTSQLLELGIGEAVKEHALDAVSVTDMDSPALVEGQPWKFSAKVEVKPKIDKVELAGLRVERKLDAVGDEEIDKEAQSLREANAELVTPDPPRDARAGDQLLLDIDVTVEGQPRPDLTSADTRAELGADRLLPEIEAGLLGAKPGEAKTIELTFPADYGNEGLRGKAASLEVKVKQLQERVLPDLDDDFAKDLGHESLAAMRGALRKQLEEQAQKKAEALVREQVVDKLVDDNPVPVPPSMIERQERAMLTELYQLQQMLGRPIPFDEKMHEELRGRAERKVRAGLLFAAIAEQQKLEVTDPEVDKRLQEIAEQTGKHVAKVRVEYQGEKREGLKSQLLQNKLLEYLLSQATITNATGEASAAPAEAESEKKPAKKAKSKSEESGEKPKAKKSKKAASSEKAGEEE